MVDTEEKYSQAIKFNRNEQYTQNTQGFFNGNRKTYCQKKGKLKIGVLSALYLDTYKIMWEV